VKNANVALAKSVVCLEKSREVKGEKAGKWGGERLGKGTALVKSRARDNS